MENSKRNIYIIAAISFVILVLAIYFFFIFQKSPKKIKAEVTSEEVKELNQIDLAMRPYVNLTPTADGAEIIISIENMGSYDRIEYELTYLADNPTATDQKIQRGSTGTDVNTKDQKYKKSILLGTASRGVRSPDRGIEDGKLTMHLFKGETEFMSETGWDLSRVSRQNTKLGTADGNFKLDTGGLSKEYWVILAETIGLPPSASFDPKKTQLPIIGVFSVAPEFTTNGTVNIKVTSAQKPQLYVFNHADTKWQKLDSDFNSAAKSVSAKINSFGTFAVVSSQ